VIVVADTSPINYLAIIGEADLLKRLYGHVLIPPAVMRELQHPAAPAAVQTWLAESPDWLEVRDLGSPPDPLLEKLDDGEREAIALAMQTHADRLIADENPARAEARKRNIPVIGTLGVLREAALAGFLDLADAIRKLEQTSFYVAPALIKSLLEEAARKP
jgi:predicted nucleic acid-binding protein